MSSPEQNRRPTGATDLRSGHQADEAAVKRAWTSPTVTTFKVSDTQGIFFGSSDGVNNLTNEG